MSAVVSSAAGAEAKRPGAGSALLGRSWLCVAPIPRNHSEAGPARRASSCMCVGSRGLLTHAEATDPARRAVPTGPRGRNRPPGPEASLCHPLVRVVSVRGSGILAASTREGRQSASARRSGSKVSIACRPAGCGGPASPRWSRGRLSPGHRRPLRRDHGRPAGPARARAPGPAVLRTGVRGSAATAVSHGPRHRRGPRRRARAAACASCRADPTARASGSSAGRRGSRGPRGPGGTPAWRAQVSSGSTSRRTRGASASPPSARGRLQQALPVGSLAV